MMTLYSGSQKSMLRLAFGLLAIIVWTVALWLSALGKPLIYGLSVILLSAWIGLLPSEKSKLGHRVMIACVSSTGICVLLMIVAELVAFVRRDGLEEFGPILFIPAFLIAIWLPVMVLAALVAALQPLISRREHRTRS